MSICGKIFEVITNNGGQALFVGGCVRDKLLGKQSKDQDIEVYGISYEKLERILSCFGSVDLVGKSFGIIKLKSGNEEFDFSLPRLDSKNGIGHKGFSVTVSSDLSIEEASKRRDFTINSIAMDFSGKIYDPNNGCEDLENKILNPTSEYFKEDVLRVLRAYKFIARYNFVASNKLIEFSKEMITEYNTLPIERIWCEWKDWAARGKGYLNSLKFLNEIGWSKLYPELHAIYGVKQEPKWHPEGTVDIHTGFVLEAMAEICEREAITGEDRLVLIFSALTHDFGKATHTQILEDGKITSKGHEAASGPLARSFLESIGCPENIIEQVVVLVENHMLWMEMSDKHIRKVAAKLAAGKTNFKMLTYLLEADRSGRPPLPRELCPGQIKNRERAIELGCWEDKPVAIIRGQDIIDLGYKPGPIVGKIVKKLYEMQLNGSFSDRETGLKRIKSFEASL